MAGLTAGNRESWLALIWQALDGLEDCNADMQAEGREEYGPDRDDICTAMAWIREGLGLPDEVSENCADSQPRAVIIVSSDDVAACPECGRRLNVEMTSEIPAAPAEVEHDVDGPIYRGDCPHHGAWLWQIDTEGATPCPVNRRPKGTCPDSCNHGEV